MIRELKIKGQEYLKKRCDTLSPTKRKWIILTMFGLFAALFLYNLIVELL